MDKETRIREFQEELRKGMIKIREERELEAIENEKQRRREKKINAIKITSICASVIVLIGSTVLIKNHIDNYNKQFYDENGKPIRITLGTDGIFTNSYIEENGIKKFRTPLVFFLINKETNETKEYIWYSEGRFRLYELDSEELVTYEYTPDLFDDGIANDVYYAYLKNNFDWVPLTDAPRYIEGFKLKETYTKEEIKEIEQELLEGYLIIKEAKHSK